MNSMRAFYLSTRNDAAARLSAGVPELNETRDELDNLGKLIIEVLAERKQHPYNPKDYNKKYLFADIHPDIMFGIYAPILKILCVSDPNFKLSEEVRRVDYEAMFLLQERILKAYDIAAYKKLHKLKIYDAEREKELLKNAEKNSKEFGLGPKIGIKITKSIIQKTKELEEIIFDEENVTIKATI